MGKPKIRFKGFTEEWEQRKLGEVVSVCSGKDYKHLDEGNIPVYGTGGYMLSVSEALSNDSDAIGIGRKGTIDKPYILKAPFWTVDTLFYCIPHEKNDLSFVFSTFQNINWKAMDESTGVPSLSKTAINCVDVIIPSFEEQEKIGCYFSNLDHLITLHQRKCDETKKLKKYMLQKMFPQNGMEVPEIRFEGFTGDWEQRKLGEIAGRTYGGGTPKTSIMEYWDGYIPWIQSSNLMEHELFNVDIQKHITDDGLKKSAAQLVPPNSVAVVSHVGVGKLAFMPFSYTTSQDFISLSELKADPVFTCYSVYKRLQNDLHIVQGSAIKGITKDDLLSKEIMLPSEAEQIKISEYFRQLDHLVTLHQQKCDKLMKIKKYMLQNMFV